MKVPVSGRRRLVLAALPLALAGFLVAVFGARLARLPAEALIHEDPLVRGDVIIAETWVMPNLQVMQTAAQLYRQGYGQAIIIPYQLQAGEAARTPESTKRLLSLYCEAVGLTPDQVEMIELKQAELNTLEDARRVSRVIRRRGATCVILVTTLFHSRKSSLSYQKFLGPDVRLVCYPVKGDLTPDNWWRTAGGRYDVLSHFVKLQYYRLVAF